MGTVVDLEGSVSQDTAAVLQRSGLAGADVDGVPGRCEQRLGQLMADVRAGRRDWQGHRELRRLALRETLADLQLPPLEPEAETEASGVIHRLTPWPDSAAALRSLQEVVTVVGLASVLRSFWARTETGASGCSPPAVVGLPGPLDWGSVAPFPGDDGEEGATDGRIPRLTLMGSGSRGGASPFRREAPVLLPKECWPRVLWGPKGLAVHGRPFLSC